MTFFPRIFESFVNAGRALLERQTRPQDAVAALSERCHALLTQHGEAAGLALAGEIMALLEELSESDQLRFFELLASEFGVQTEAVLTAADRYRAKQDGATLSELSKSLDAPRQTLFRRLNLVPGGTGTIIRLRERLLEALPLRPDFTVVESDLHELLMNWFNGGFLTLRQIDWTSSATVLERIIQYEAVHEIHGWDDLRNRLREDRRCFAYFHFAMPDDPLIFVQVALTEGLAAAIEPLLAFERDIGDPRAADTAMFYSISNCHAGLQGISFGHFLIKQVVEELRRDLDNIEQFATLSPIPGFRPWLLRADAEAVPAELRAVLERLRAGLGNGSGAEQPPALANRLATEQAGLLGLCAHYLLETRRDDGQPLDPVARFHLANGASVERLNWAADQSAAGFERSLGIMVNYLYAPKEIERHHEAYFRDGSIAASSQVRRLLRAR